MTVVRKLKGISDLSDSTKLVFNAYEDDKAVKFEPTEKLFASVYEKSSPESEEKPNHLFDEYVRFTDDDPSQIVFFIADQSIKKLDVGYYGLRIGTRDENDQVVSYPSDGLVWFYVYNTDHSKEIIKPVPDTVYPQPKYDGSFYDEVVEFGPQGPKGDKGEAGPAGPQGPKGATGPKGDKGDVGPQGVQGIQGERGAQGEQGQQGIQGVAGKDFSITKTFPSVVSMNGTGLTTGDFVMISSTVEDPDNSKLYLWNGTEFTFVTDMSGATGVKGDKGEQGIQGKQGVQGEQGKQGIQGIQGETGAAGKDAVINVVTQAEYDALPDKTGVYFIGG